jgi:methyl-accepting chemotaxis protein
MIGKRGLSFKIGLGFGFIVLLTAVVGGMGWFGVDKLHRQLEAYSAWVEIDTVMHSTITTYVAGLKHEIATYTDSPTRDRFDALILSQERIHKNIKNWQKRFANHTKIEVTATQALKHLTDLEAATRRFQEMFDNLELSNTFEVAVAMQKSNDQLVKVFSVAMNEIINPAKKRESAEASLVHQQIFYLVLAMVFSSLLLGIFLSFRIARNVTQPIRRAIEDLTGEAESGKTSSLKFSDTSHQLADAASQQSAALEETVASLEEISSQASSNAAHAGQAKDLMMETSRVIADVDEIMGELKRSMDQISEKSDDTQKIVKTIDEIAFQTNLLALNAAVEAARAGEEGLGFAVVADEVRNLAMRAAEASHDTAEQIKGTAQIIASGADLVTRTIEAFAKANEKSTQTTTLVSEITSASQEQLQGIEQLTEVATEMDRNTQWTAVSAQETAFASESLQEQATRIKKTVDDLARLIHGGDSGDDVPNASREPKIIPHEPPYEITESRTSDQHLLPDPERDDQSDNFT